MLSMIADFFAKIGGPVFDIVFKYWHYILLVALVTVLYFSGVFDRWI